MTGSISSSARLPEGVRLVEGLLLETLCSPGELKCDLLPSFMLEGHSEV